MEPNYTSIRSWVCVYLLVRINCVKFYIAAASTRKYQQTGFNNNDDVCKLLSRHGRVLETRPSIKRNIPCGIFYRIVFSFF